MVVKSTHSKVCWRPICSEVTLGAQGPTNCVTFTSVHMSTTTKSHEYSSRHNHLWLNIKSLEQPSTLPSMILRSNKHHKSWWGKKRLSFHCRRKLMLVISLTTATNIQLSDYYFLQQISDVTITQIKVIVCVYCIDVWIHNFHMRGFFW